MMIEELCLKRNRKFEKYEALCDFADRFPIDELVIKKLRSTTSYQKSQPLIKS